ncbi:MAG: hypothetical protein J6I60_05690 [Bacteroidaceae bacterium]|nr:hypothetical protein [Bacteroidaceae bacterium]
MNNNRAIHPKPHHWLSLLSLAAVLLMFASCADDLYEEGANRRPLDFSDYPTRFAAVESLEEASASKAAKKISTDYDKKWWWTFGDHIFVKDGSSFVRSDTSDIPLPATGVSLVQDANFYFKETFEGDRYDVYYTGNGGTNGKYADSVHITPVQWQTAFGAGHVGKYGDCATGTATRQNESLFHVQLNHKASYLLFTPRVANASYNTKLRSITVTSDNTICGDYAFGAGGLDKDNVKNGGKKITLNLYTVDALGKEHYPFALSDFKDTDKCLYMVLQPGDHKVSITYEMVDSLGKKSNMQIQQVKHNKLTNKYEYSYTDSIAPATRWKVTRELKSTAHTFTENGFTKVSHKLEGSTELMRFRIPYTYYEWGAAGWFWLTAAENAENGNGSATYSFYPQLASGHSSTLRTLKWTYSTGWPTNADPSDISNYERSGAPLSYIYPGWSYLLGYTGDQNANVICYPKTLWLGGTTSTNRWWYPTRYGGEVIECPYAPYVTQGRSDINVAVSSFVSTIYGKTIGSKYHTVYWNSGQGNVMRSIFKMPSANEMTYYLKYGDIHRDNSTLWKIEGYCGDTTLCRGGIWVKKKKVIEAEGHSFSSEVSAYNNIDLRYQSPGNNYIFRHYNEDAQVPAAEAAGGAVADVKYGVPANKDDYFFLPLLGYMHNVGNSPGTSSNGMDWSANKGQYKFVGAEGYYWTRTMWPNSIIAGQTNAYNTHGDRESYYLHITPYYVALCWDIRANRIHGFVGNERPDWCRTMPYAERYTHEYGGESKNDTWFQ